MIYGTGTVIYKTNCFCGSSIDSRAVVSRDMSRSRDSLETQFFKVSVSSRSRRCEVSVSVSSRHLEVSENERVSRPLFKVRFKIE